MHGASACQSWMCQMRLKSSLACREGACLQKPLLPGLWKQRNDSSAADASGSSDSCHQILLGPETPCDGLCACTLAGQIPYTYLLSITRCPIPQVTPETSSRPVSLQKYALTA